MYDKAKKPRLRINSNTSIRSSWHRFKDSEQIIIVWENRFRNGGAIVEEIKEIAPNFPIRDKVAIVTTNPTREDVIYFNELGIRTIIRLVKQKYAQKTAETDLLGFIKAEKKKLITTWDKIITHIDLITPKTPPAKIKKLMKVASRLANEIDKRPSARYHDAMGSLYAAINENERALDHWQKALDINPNYYRTFSNMVQFYERSGDLEKSLQLMHKLQSFNNKNISRLVKMGEVHSLMKDDIKAEHYFTAALKKDSACSAALNGMAGIRFRQGELEETRNFLSKSNIAYKMASSLNKEGIELVKSGRFQAALDHYSKAQYVLPYQDKGPMLFYNMGLCYSRWGRTDLAMQFLKIALIKEPNYKKAFRLLNFLETGNAPSMENGAQ